MLLNFDVDANADIKCEQSTRRKIWLFFSNVDIFYRLFLFFIPPFFRFCPLSFSVCLRFSASARCFLNISDLSIGSIIVPSCVTCKQFKKNYQGVCSVKLKIKFPCSLPYALLRNDRTPSGQQVSHSRGEFNLRTITHRWQSTQLRGSTMTLKPLAYVNRS